MASSRLRRSIFRILTDLIKADDIITVEELDGLEEAAARYGITPEDRTEGCMMTLQEAVECIGAQSQKVKDGIRSTMVDIAVKDGECCRAESLMLTMMDYLCKGDRMRVMSMEFRNRALLSTQILYLENGHGPQGRNALDEEFGQICNIVRLGGLELIYIPKVSEHFRTHDNDGSLSRLMSVISPLSDPHDLENTVTALKGMSTRFFYNNVIRGKLAMDISIEEPAWIIRIPDSTVGSRQFVNFLCLDVKDDMKGQLTEFVSLLNSRQGSYSVKVNDAKGRDRSFIYNGFYKALLDLMSVRRIDKWDLHVRLYGEGSDMFRYSDAEGHIRRCVMTMSRDGEEYPIPLTGRDAAFYLLLICSAAQEGGIDFHDEALRDDTQRRYSAIFRALSRRSEEPLAWDPVFRVPMRSRVAAAINDSPAAKISSLEAVYLPAEKRKGLLYVPLEAERVFIHSPKGIRPLKESALFRQTEPDRSLYKGKR